MLPARNQSIEISWQLNRIASKSSIGSVCTQLNNRIKSAIEKIATTSIICSVLPAWNKSFESIPQLNRIASKSSNRSVFPDRKQSVENSWQLNRIATPGSSDNLIPN